MTRTARRRWSREFHGEIDGIVLAGSGFVFLHGYDPPAGGKWIDSVIPGKLAAYDRHEGDLLWVSPCEVGYGRGFASGLGNEEDVVVLGPSSRGHRIARMSIASGELIGARPIEPFDQAIVAGDMCITVTPGRLAGIMTSPMIEVWSHAREGERYHLIGRSGPHALVAYTNTNVKMQGVLRIDVDSGDFVSSFLEPVYPVIHDLAVEGDLAVILIGSHAPDARRRVTGPQELSIAAFSTAGGGEAAPLWRRVVANESADDLPDVSISLDSGKLYVTRGAMLEIWDGLSGRVLGELTIPGLDERIAWQVSQGAALLAEETRASVFELPA